MERILGLVRATVAIMLGFSGASLAQSDLNTSADGCQDFSGIYDNIGVVEKAGGTLSQGGPVLLSVGVFGATLPGLERPNSVRLMITPDKRHLVVTLFGKGTHHFNVPLVCKDRKYQIELHSKNLQAGEGVDLIRSNKALIFQPDISGLRVRYLSTARYRTWPFFYKTEKIDSLYLFHKKFVGGND